MFKVKNKDTRTTSMVSFWCLYCSLWTYFTPRSSVSTVNFEQVNAEWILPVFLLQSINYRSSAPAERFSSKKVWIVFNLAFSIIVLQVSFVEHDFFLIFFLTWLRLKWYAEGDIFVNLHFNLRFKILLMSQWY